jgi:hypothetical protein
MKVVTIDQIAGYVQAQGVGQYHSIQTAQHKRHSSARQQLCGCPDMNNGKRKEPRAQDVFHVQVAAHEQYPAKY